MANNFQFMKIGDFADVKSGKRLPKDHTLVNYPTQYPYIRLVDIEENRISKADMLYLEKDTYEKIARYIVNEHDVGLAIVGNTIGLVFTVDKKWDGANLTENAARLTNFRGVAPHYVFYYLRSRDGQDQIISRTVGSAQGKLPLYNIKNIEIPLPPLAEQRAIAGILGALDDKIELNRRMNQTLQSMARAVFRQWFVENEEVGDWEIKNLGEITERVGMGPFGSSIKVDTFVDEGIPIINGQQLREFMLEDSSFNFISLEHAEKLKNANVYPGDIVLTHRGTLGQVSLIPYDAKYERYIVSQSQFFVRCNLERLTPNFLIYYLRSPEGQHKLLANRSAVGVPAIAQPVTYLRSIEIAVPPKEILDAFEQIVAPLHRKYSANRRESLTLASLRDSLLPKLMRGDVRVKVNTNKS